jgi:hypothetical protein
MTPSIHWTWHRRQAAVTQSVGIVRLWTQAMEFSLVLSSHLRRQTKSTIEYRPPIMHDSFLQPALVLLKYGIVMTMTQVGKSSVQFNQFSDQQIGIWFPTESQISSCPLCLDLLKGTLGLLSNGHRKLYSCKKSSWVMKLTTLKCVKVCPYLPPPPLHGTGNQVCSYFKYSFHLDLGVPWCLCHLDSYRRHCFSILLSHISIQILCPVSLVFVFIFIHFCCMVTPGQVIQQYKLTRQNYQLLAYDLHLLQS